MAVTYKSPKMPARDKQALDSVFTTVYDTSATMWDNSSLSGRMDVMEASAVYLDEQIDSLSSTTFTLIQDTSALTLLDANGYTDTEIASLSTTTFTLIQDTSALTLLDANGYTDTEIASLSTAQWNSVYTQVYTLSDGWGSGGGDYPPGPIILAYSATVTPNLNDGLLRTTSLTGNIVLTEPTNPVAGAIWTWYITASDEVRDLSLHENIKIPSDSVFTSPKTLEADKTYILQLRYIGSSWCLTSLVGGY